MTTSEDVKTLFRRFGGQPETYQEVVREDLAEHSLGKWPMLGQVNLQKIDSIPSARQTIHTAATRPYSESLAEATAEHIQAIKHATLMQRERASEPAAAQPAPQPIPEVAPTTSQRFAPRTEVPANPPAVYSHKAVHATSPLNSHAPVPAAPPAAMRVSSIPAPRPEPVVEVAPAIVAEAAAMAAPAVSGLAARFRAQAAPASIPQNPPAPPAAQSLHGLFGRLAHSTVADQGASVLKRKLIK